MTSLAPALFSDGMTAPWHGRRRTARENDSERGSRGRDASYRHGDVLVGMKFHPLQRETRSGPLLRGGHVETVQQPAGEMVDADQIDEIHYSLFSEGTRGGVVQIRVNAVLS